MFRLPLRVDRDRRPAGPAMLVAVTAMAAALVAAGCAAGSPASTGADVPRAPAAEASPAPVTETAPGIGEAPPEPGAQTGQLPADPGAAQLVVRTGFLELEVGELDTALRASREAVAALGGYVSASDEQSDGEARAATITYRIPAERWDEALAAVRGVGGRVLREETRTEEVTAQVVDLEARITNLRSSEAALQQIMTRASAIPDVLTVQGKLTEVRGEIERLTAQKTSFEGRAALSTLTVSFRLPVVAVTRAGRDWNLGVELDQAVAQLVRVAQGLASVAIWFGVVGLPVLLPIGALAVLAVRYARRRANEPPVAPA